MATRFRGELLPWDSQPQEVVPPLVLQTLIRNPAVHHITDAPRGGFQLGRSYKFNGTSEQARQIHGESLPAEYSIICVAKINSLPAATTQAIVCGLLLDSPGNPFIAGSIVLADTGAVSVMVRAVGSAPRYGTSSRTLVVGDTVVLLASIQAANRTLWVDGKNPGNTTYNSPTTVNSELVLGAFTSYSLTTGYAGVDIGLVAVLPYPIRSDAQAKEVSDNYLNFVFAPQSIWVPVSAGGAPPTFIPSWAHRRARTIGAGVI